MSANTAPFAMVLVTVLVMGVALGGSIGHACGYSASSGEAKPKIEAAALPTYRSARISSDCLSENVNEVEAAAHYGACKLVRTIKPANTAEVECYDCAGVEECVVPFWRSP